MSLPTTPALPPRPLAAALAVLLGAAPSAALATQLVSNCNDKDSGSLRAALGNAAEGELIDATGLQCSTISLTTGALIVANNNQKIDGPGADKLTIDGSGNKAGYGLFFHNGNGTLEIDHVTLSHGNKYLNSDTMFWGGGCVSSFGSVTLTNTVVSDCAMTAGPKSHARGGAIYADGDVTLTNSVVSGSSAHGASPLGYEINTYGGGVFAKGTTHLDHSTVSGNHAINGGGLFSRFAISAYASTLSHNDANLGGAIDCECALQINASTIADNHAHLSGGIYLGIASGAPSVQFFILDSTITGNTISANFSAAAMETAVPITISNSTIAFNIAPNVPVNGEGALYSFADTLTLQDTIIAGNYPADVDVQSGTTTVNGNGNLSPASRATMPGDTRTDCPQLQPLSWNGGPVQTLALRHTSPAIDTGHNPLVLSHDERGPGFPRVFGAEADIGAFEWQGDPVDDNLFRGTFELALGLCQP